MNTDKQRVIKFRGLPESGGDFVYGYYFEKPLVHGSHATILMDGSDLEDEDEDNYQVHVKRDTVGQFTGLLDKNGKEIYEGDIVETISGHICEVKWSITKEVRGVDFYQYHGFCLHNIKQKRNYHLDTPENVEIIGHIYSPEK